MVGRAVLVPPRSLCGGSNTEEVELAKELSTSTRSYRRGQESLNPSP